MRPFEQYVFSSATTNIKDQAIAFADGFTDEELMANDITVLCNNTFEKFKVLPVVIDDSIMPKPVTRRGKIEKYLDHVHYFNGGRTVVVDGITLIFSFNFSGDAMLFNCRASSYSMSSYPDIRVSQDTLSFKYEFDSIETSQTNWHDKVIERLKSEIEEIKKGLRFINDDAQKFNRELLAVIQAFLRDKKRRVEIFYAAAKAFDVSVAPNDEGKRVIAVQKRNVLPIAHSFDSSEPEYTITGENYNEILKVIKHTASTWERTPNSFRYMGEEDLRNVLLASLNGLFLGKANGEAFRKDGKTDICIEAENRSAFIAECKMWTGEKTVVDAFAQLDSYSTWRDCKTALIYFVNRQDFLAIVEKMNVLLPTLDIIQGTKKIDKNEVVCQMASTRTPGHLITVRVMLFNLHSDEDKKGATK